MVKSTSEGPLQGRALAKTPARTGSATFGTGSATFGTGYLRDRLGYLRDRLGYLRDRLGYLRDRLGYLQDRLGYLRDRLGYTYLQCMAGQESSLLGGSIGKPQPNGGNLLSRARGGLSRYTVLHLLTSLLKLIITNEIIASMRRGIVIQNK